MNTLNCEVIYLLPQFKYNKNYCIINEEIFLKIKNVLTGSIIEECKYVNLYKGNPTTVIINGKRKN